jgi:drug/metabolite transporter (DMT)-like permease
MTASHRRRDSTVSRELGAGRARESVTYLAVVIVAWGSHYTWSKMALDDNGPWTFNALRCALAALLLGAALTVADGRGAVLPVRAERVGIAVIGALQVAAVTSVTSLALTMIDASRTILIVYSMPIWGMLLSFLILGERATWTMLLGTLTGLSGLLLLCAPWAMDWTSRSAIVGSLYALAGTIAWALGSVLYRRTRWTSSFGSQIFGQFAAASIILVPLAFILETRSPTYTPRFAVLTLWSAIVPTIVGYYCWAKALERLPVATASQVLLLSPVFGVLLSAFVLGERVTIGLLSSAALILIGSGLSYIPARSEPPSS